jgi:phosphopantothenate---cysteine ligase (CTP)
MKILVTAGATVVPIDQVRAITNIFKGKTGTDIAQHFAQKGDSVTLITSSPQLVSSDAILRIVSYKTYDDLAGAMEQEVSNGDYDIVIHSAAVSDYAVTGVLARDEERGLVRLDSSQKVSSSHDSLYLELTPTKKLIDMIRRDWGFRGKLVKFKLEVGRAYDELIAIAIKSVRDSKADLIVANCLEWYGQSAILVTPDGHFDEIERHNLSSELRRRLL